MLTLLDPADAAEVIGEVPEAQAVDLIEDLPPEQAAAIVEELPSDLQADLLGQLEDEETEEILLRMPDREASGVRQLLAYPADTAGGVMVTEYLAYRDDQTVADLRGYSEALKKLQPGQAVTVQVHREGQTVQVKVTVVER